MKVINQQSFRIPSNVDLKVNKKGKAVFAQPDLARIYIIDCDPAVLKALFIMKRRH